MLYAGKEDFTLSLTRALAAGAYPDLLARMQAHNVMYDRDADGEFFQIYTQTFDERFFFEIVERRNYRGFGAPNAQVRLTAQARQARAPGVPRR